MGNPASGGASLGNAVGKLSIDTTQAQQAVPVMQGVASGVERAMAGVNTAASKTQATMAALGQAFGISLGVAGVVQLGRMGAALAVSSAQAELTRQSFERLAEGAGVSSDELLDAMNKAAHGTVSESQTILSANRALVSGVADSAEEFGQIMEIARATGQAFGFSTEDAFTRIVSAVSKLEPELLDELGVTMRLDDVFRAYAATLGKTSDELTQTERRQAMLEEVIRQTADTVDAASDAAITASESFQQLGVSADKAGQAVGNFVSAAGGLVSFGLSGWLQQATDDVNALAEAFNFLAAHVPGSVQYQQRVNPPGTIRSRWPGTRPGGPPAAPDFDAKEMEAISNWAEERTEIERDANRIFWTKISPTSASAPKALPTTSRRSRAWARTLAVSAPAPRPTMRMRWRRCTSRRPRVNSRRLKI